jgi:transcription initiation factor TFIIB
MIVRKNFHSANYLSALLADLSNFADMQLNGEILQTGNWENCPLCRGKVVFDNESGENVCNSCGLVVGMDQAKPESRVLERTTPNLGLLAASPRHFGQTFIDRRNVDSRGRRVETSDNMFMIRRLDSQSLADSSERSINRAAAEIMRITERLGIGVAIRREAMSIYLKASKDGLIRGRSIDGICAAAIYVACRKLNVPRLLPDIVLVATNEDVKHIAPYCKLLIRRLGIKLSQPDASEYVDHVARNARIGSRTQRRALLIVTSVEGNPRFCGKRPISIAAAAIYLASKETGEHSSQLRIAGASNLTPSTVRKTAMEIEQVLADRVEPPPTESSGTLKTPVPLDESNFSPSLETLGNPSANDEL